MKINKSHLISLIILLLNIFGTKESDAQCNDSLVKQAIMESGHDAVFLKEYKVKFKKGKASRPTRVAKYTTFMKDSTTYRFNVANANEYEGKVILQLYNNDKLFGSTYDIKTLNDNKSFDFKCEKEGSYQILMSFMEGKAGCAAAILSMVINDSTVIEESELPEAMYINIKNPLYIAYTDEPGCSVSVFSDQGKIEGQKGKYTIIPDTVGTLLITVQTIDNKGNIKEEISKEFIVKDIPLPYVSLNGNTGGLISKSDLQNMKQLDIHINQIFGNENFEITNFTVSDKFIGISGKSSDNEYFNFSQLRFFESLEPGNQFYIKNIKAKLKDNSIVELKPIGFIVY